MWSYVLKENEVKMIRTKYNPETGEFLGLYKTIGFMVHLQKRSYATTDTIRTNPRFYIRITEGEFLTLSAESYLTDTVL